MADIFQTWKEGDLDSYLIEITAAVLRKTDAGTGKPLVDVILDRSRAEGDRPLDGAERARAWRAADRRSPRRSSPASSRRSRAMRLALDKKTPHPALETRKPEKAEIDAIRDALYASKIVAYAPGLRADVSGLGAVPLGPQARRHGDHLARRMHHPRPLPRSHQGSLRSRPQTGQPAVRRLFPRGRHKDRERLAAA